MNETEMCLNESNGIKSEVKISVYLNFNFSFHFFLSLSLSFFLSFITKKTSLCVLIDEYEFI